MKEVGHLRCLKISVFEGGRKGSPWTVNQVFYDTDLGTDEFILCVWALSGYIEVNCGVRSH